MKPLFSEQYYKDHWDKFLERVPGDDYINLEGELEKALAVFKGILADEQIKAVKPIYAKPIAEKGHTLVLKELKTMKEVLAGETGFGYTTKRQEIDAQYRFRTRFDFNCLQLREFKKNHNID